MKNLNLLESGETLTKEQMKKITGGYIGCDVSDAGGEVVGTAICFGSACACQDSLDKECEKSDGCSDIDCGCK